MSFLVGGVEYAARKPYINNHNVLRCPTCNGTHGEHYLHQAFIRVLFREEDKDGYMHLIDENDEHDTQLYPAPLIPGRRDVVEIEFACELCGRHSVLQFLQDRGQTIVQWGIREENPPLTRDDG